MSLTRLNQCPVFSWGREMSQTNLMRRFPEVPARPSQYSAFPSFSLAYSLWYMTESNICWPRKGGRGYGKSWGETCVDTVLMHSLKTLDYKYRLSYTKWKKILEVKIETLKINLNYYSPIKTTTKLSNYNLLETRWKPVPWCKSLHLTCTGDCRRHCKPISKPF